MLSMRTLTITSVPLVLLVMVLTSADKRFERKMKKVIEHYPEVLADGLKAAPLEFAQTLHRVTEQTRVSQVTIGEEGDEEEFLRFQQALKSPVEPLIRQDELIRGPANGELTLIMYADFACPLTAQSFNTVRDLRESYKGQLRLIVKHLPHEMHANAMISAQYYEALRLQSEELAVMFHDQLFDEQKNLRKGESFLYYTARDLGADMLRLAQDLDSKEVEKRIEQDIREAHSFGIQTTPGFLLNGVPITGAYPIDHFRALIDKLQTRSYVSF